MRGLLRTLSIVIVLLVVAGLGVWRLGTASGDRPTLSMMVSPASVSAGGATFDVQISVAGVTNLGAYEWQLSFDPNVVAFESATNGVFLGSTGRSVSCFAGPHSAAVRGSRAGQRPLWLRATIDPGPSRTERWRPPLYRDIPARGRRGAEHAVRVRRPG